MGYCSFFSKLHPYVYLVFQVFLTSFSLSWITTEERTRATQNNRKRRRAPPDPAFANSDVFINLESSGSSTVIAILHVICYIIFIIV